MQAGVYRHYKGHYYLVLGLANDADSDDGRLVVVYVGLDLQGAVKPVRMHVRTAKSFHGIVDQENMTRRFTFVGYGVPDLDSTENHA